MIFDMRNEYPNLQTYLNYLIAAKFVFGTKQYYTFPGIYPQDFLERLWDLVWDAGQSEAGTLDCSDLMFQFLQVWMTKQMVTFGMYKQKAARELDFEQNLV